MCVSVNHVRVEYQSYVMALIYAAEELNNSYLLDMQSRILKSALSSKFVIKLGKVQKLQWEGIDEQKMPVKPSVPKHQDSKKKNPI